MVDEITKNLRTIGYRITKQRRTILEAINSSKKHLTPDELYGIIKKKNSSIGRVTVYRTLEMLNKNNLLCRVNVSTAAHNYLIKRPKEHHHHLICNSCGKVVDFDYCVMDELVKKLSKHSFDIKDHVLEVYGLCDKCKVNNKKDGS